MWNPVKDLVLQLGTFEDVIEDHPTCHNALRARSKSVLLIEFESDDENEHTLFPTHVSCVDGSPLKPFLSFSPNRFYVCVYGMYKITCSNRHRSKCWPRVSSGTTTAKQSTVGGCMRKD